MLDEYSKFEGRRGFSLDDVFGPPTSPVADVPNEELADLLRLIEVANTLTTPSELKGYYPYRLLIGDRYFYPRRGSLRMSSAHDIYFIDDLMTDDADARPAYVTVPLNRVVATTWLPEDDEQANEAALEEPLAA